MGVVNTHYVRRLLDPFISLTDEEIAALSRINPDDEQAVREVLRQLIVPEYLRYGPKSRQISKDSLRYMLSVPDTLYEDFLLSRQPPFDLPMNARNFFVWLWKELFGDEAYDFHEAETLTLQNDEDAPNLAYLR